MLSNLEYRFIIWSIKRLLNVVSPWPLIKVKSKHEHLTIQKVMKTDAFLQKNWNRFVENVARDIVVLELDDVLNHRVHSLYLVVSQGVIDWTSVVEVITSLLLDLILVDDRVLF